MSLIALVLSIFLLISPSIKAAESCDILPKLAPLLGPEETQRLIRMQESSKQQILGARFLHQQNPKLHLTPEVERAASLLRNFGAKGINTPEEKITAWIVTLERTHINKNAAAQEALKRYYQQRYVITKEDFPDSYFKLQKKIAKEQGRGDIDISPADREPAKGLILPPNFKGNLWLDGLQSAEGLVLPANFDGKIRLNSLGSAKGLVFPTEFNGKIELNALQSADGLVISRKLKEKVTLPLDIEPTWID